MLETKDYTVYDSTDREFLEKGKTVETESRLLVAWGHKWAVIGNVHKKTFRSDRNVLNLNCGDSCKITQIYKSLSNWILKMVDFFDVNYVSVKLFLCI